jgi:predicted  nucleic acid-binding Zn-ribbon protein
LELDRLLNTDLAQTNQKLNQQLNQVSLQKDFIQSQFEKSIDLEVEALQRYHSALGDTAEEIDFAMREVGVILDADPKKARAFDIEKYATYAGLSNDFIQKSINAVNNDDWDAQKNILKDITKALAKNPKWVVDVPSNAELNVMIAEEKAIQEAAMIAIEGQKIKEQVDKIINEKTSSLKQLSSLNLGTLKYAATWEGMPEHEFLTKEYDELINEANLTSKLLEYENKSKSFKPAYENWVKNMTEANRQEWVNIQNDMNKLQRETSQIQWDAQKKMRENVIKAVEDAKVSINEITQNEIAKNAGYNYADNINKILDKIPSFDSAKRQRANEVLSGIGHTDIWFGGVPIEVGDQGAALRAALGERSDYEAYTAALKAMAEMGEKPVSEYMTGPYWEMTNVKAAAIVRSKKYDYVDDYEYMNAYYRDPLQLNTTQRQEVEGELKNILGNNNPKFNALSKQANSLKSEIETNNVKLSNINSNISELENEISSIKSSEQNLKNQISKLNNDLTSKQSLINGKNKSLTDLQKNLDPINNKISELEAKKNDLNNNIQNQINLVTQNTKKSEEITQKTLELENKLSKEMSEIDQQINGYKKETEKLTVNISSLNNEILNLENEKPDLSNKISKINEELTGYSNVKAELSVLTAEQKAEVKNIDIDINKLESELSNLKTSESQINQQLASLSNELKSKEDIIKNNNLSISEIQKQIDPLNSQIETLENQKVSLNEQFNKDFAELSNQIEQTTETKSAEIDKLKVDFETQISKFNEEINNFESQANELNSTVSALNEEIKSIEVETPQISNQIAKLNQDIKNFTDIKADLAMATAKNIGLKVDEKVIQSIERLDGTAIIVFNDGLVRVIDEKMLIDQAEKFIYPLSEFSINSKIYTADAVRPELLYVEEITNAYTKAKAARLEARENWNAATSSGSKEEKQAAEDAFMAAKDIEIAAGQSLVSNSKMASATAQQATLENLRAIASTPGMGKWDVRRANAAVKAAEAQIAGTNFNYEQAVNKIANDEKKWNVWRVDLYKKDIEAAKASGKTREMALLQRDMERFKQRRIDEVVYREAIQTKQSNYLGVLNNVAIKSAVLSGASLQETTKALAGQSSSAAASFSIMDAKNMTQQQARTAQAAKSAARAADKTATLSTDTNALRAAGASAEQATAYEAARAAKQTARQNWNAASASGNKAAEAAAEAAFMAAREAETVAGRAAADAAAQASVAASAATAAAQEVAQEVTAAAQGAAAEVTAVAQDATRAAQEATLAALQEIEAMPGGSSWDAFAAQAAIEQVKAEMEGRDYSGKWGSSYEESIAEIERMKSTGKSASECISAEGC